MAVLPVILGGAGGRMGGACARALAQNADMVLAAAWDSPDSPLLGQSLNGVTIGRIGDNPPSGRAALIDFSHPAALAGMTKWAAAHQAIYVCGTTGLSAEQEESLQVLGKTLPLVRAKNMSLGVALAEALVEKAAAKLSGWDIEIIDFHHRQKQDSPSGTGLLLAQAAARGRGQDLNTHLAVNRQGARQEKSIGLASLRGGSSAGEHEVLFAGEGERLVIRHSAEDRMIFAEGALKAARWAADKQNGYFTMRDVLGL